MYEVYEVYFDEPVLNKKKITLHKNSHYNKTAKNKNKKQFANVMSRYNRKIELWKVFSYDEQNLMKQTVLEYPHYPHIKHYYKK